MESGRTLLTNFTYDVKDGNECAEFQVMHSNGVTTLEQKLYIEKQFGKWTASIAFDDFPEQESGEDAALKLAEWMDRLAKAIRVGDLTIPNPQTRFTDIVE